MKLRLINTATDMTFDFEADSPESLRRQVNPLMYAIHQDLDKLEPVYGRAFERALNLGRRIEILVWCDLEKYWAGPYLPTSNAERWLKPLNSDEDALWLWRRLAAGLDHRSGRLRHNG